MRTANYWKRDVFLTRDCREFSLWMSGPMYVGKNIIIAIEAYDRRGSLPPDGRKAAKGRKGMGNQDSLEGYALCGLLPSTSLHLLRSQEPSRRVAAAWHHSTQETVGGIS